MKGKYTGRGPDGLARYQEEEAREPARHIPPEVAFNAPRVVRRRLELANRMPRVRRVRKARARIVRAAAKYGLGRA